MDLLLILNICNVIIQVVEGSSDRNILLRMARSVGADTMVSGVENSVKPRMKGKDTDALKVEYYRTISCQFN